MRNWLKTLRKENSLTQKEIATSCGITQQYYQLIENGDRKKNLDIDLANKLAGLFGVSLDFILTEEQKLHKSA